jgi:hypothetical protein
VLVSVKIGEGSACLLGFHAPEYTTLNPTAKRSKYPDTWRSARSKRNGP